MPHLAIALVACSAVLALGCAGDPNEPSPAPAGPGADAVLVNERTHVVDDGTLFGTCTGEMFTVTGFIHEKNAVTETATGVVHQVMTATFHLVATSPTTGETFLIQSVATATFPDVRELSEGTTRILTLYVTKGSSPNEVPFHFRYHLTYNANGTITSSFSDLETTCA